MKLNPDCVRDLLLTLEELLQFDDNMEYPTIFSEAVEGSPQMKGYSKQDIAYTTLKLIEAGYINAAPIPGDNCYNGALYSSITYPGHEFLDTVRPPDVWTETKSKAKKIGSFALNILAQIASSVIASRING